MITSSIIDVISKRRYHVTNSLLCNSKHVLAKTHVTWLFLANNHDVTTRGKQKTYLNKNKQYITKIVLVSWNNSVCFPLIILKIYWLKHMSHDYPWRIIIILWNKKLQWILTVCTCYNIIEWIRFPCFISCTKFFYVCVDFYTHAYTLLVLYYI